MMTTHKKRFVIHLVILLSVAIILSMLMFFSSKEDISLNALPGFFLQTSSSIFLLLAPPAYFNIYWLIPNFLVKKKYLIYTIIVVALVVVWGYILGIGEPWIDRNWFNEPNEKPNYGVGVIGIVLLLIITTLLHISYRWFIQLSTIKQIENDQLHLELSSLKNQINPHFFFNTLNNLYALSLEKSDQTPSVILKLSEMMRYTIYDCKEQEVSLEGELTYIENFIALQKVRHHKRGVITLKNDIDNTNIKIAPMILIVFIENAFKHGFDLLDKEAFINISLKNEDNILQFYIENNFSNSTEKHEKGIGLENVKRRLALIYPDTHELKIVKNETLFSVDLKLYV
ncbi:sensor histidine kinase [Aquimarina sp. MMG015]|uniref:sensor histidine kinase n=1 Tax=Aquimarina sp. MMG015 TaxID=2822689 RepID=UPI001B39E573|nr:histidine kinase [Aquimarina sp. MMG015]MBQ4801633.1 sensor histidine kinase [Aquimarina sp. MMG015]